jgi:monovalent cation:H+ antiporter, CPA1 family
MDQFIRTETLIIELLLVASLVAIAVRRLRVPYTVALVVVGLLLGALQPIRFEVASGLVVRLVVRPRGVAAAFHLRLAHLQRDLPTIALLAVPGVVIGTLIVGGLIGLLTPLALPAALVFGALISATDPVSVVALFRVLGVPKRLAVLMEGESLLNDGTAIVLFSLVLGSALTGQFNVIRGVFEFFKVSLGGLAVGLSLGWLVSRVIARVDDYLIETALTAVLAFGSYLVADRLHCSGVLAVVAAGLICGNLGPQGMSPTTRVVLFNFWEFVAFLANSLVFLLIGLQIYVPDLVSVWKPIAAAILAVLLSRAIVTYGLGWLANRFVEPIPLRWLHVLNWGGLRGAISLALALSLPATMGADRHLIQLMAFGVVLFTLLVQGSTMKPLLRRLGIVERAPAQTEYEMRHARLTAYRSAAEHLDQMYRDGLLSEHTWEVLRPELVGHARTLAAAARDLLRAQPELALDELARARRELVGAQRSTLRRLLRDGIISEEVFESLVCEIDAGIAVDGASDDEDSRHDGAAGSEEGA